MKNTSFIIFFFLSSLLRIDSLCAFTILDLINEKGSDGDTVILEYSAIVYGISLHKESKSLFIAKAPLQLKERDKFPSWISWMNDGAQGSLDSISCPLSECTTSSTELFTFLLLDWKKELESSRKKRGAEPMSGELDFRLPWNPKITIEEQTIQGISSDACTAVWPADDSELSQRALVAYFPTDERTVPWCPYWIESAGGKQACFVLDSKKGRSKDEQSFTTR